MQYRDKTEKLITKMNRIRPGLFSLNLTRLRAKCVGLESGHDLLYLTLHTPHKTPYKHTLPPDQRVSSMYMPPRSERYATMAAVHKAAHAGDWSASLNQFQTPKPEPQPKPQPER